MTSTPTHDEELERYFEANFLDGDKLQKGQLVSALDVIEFIKAREKLIRKQAKNEVVTVLKSRMLKHFTKWGGAQGNCVSEDTLDDFLESLNSSKTKLKKEG